MWRAGNHIRFMDYKFVSPSNYVSKYIYKIYRYLLSCLVTQRTIWFSILYKKSIKTYKLSYNTNYIIYVRRKQTFSGVNRDLHTTFGVR